MLSAVWYNTSAGQLPVEPEQLSAGSHTPADWRHVVVEDLKPSTQVLAPPRQESVASQGPPLEVPTQAVVDGWKAFAGQAPEEPVQLSATSHWPAEVRHVVVEVRKPSTQVFVVPAHESDASQGPPLELPVQAVVDGWNPSAGQVADEPVQLSAMSH